MQKKLLFAVAALVAAAAFADSAKAQTNLQMFWDFGKDRGHLTTTLEGFYNDNWGNTFFFIDHDYNSEDEDHHKYAPSGTYLEIARCLNFWQDSKLAPLSLHVEYNGGVYNGYTINNAFLGGLDYFLHSSDFRNTLNLKVLYKHINFHGVKLLDGSKAQSDLPLQLTAVWGMQDLFNVKGLRFSGFADFWWEDHNVFDYKDSEADSYRDWTSGEVSHVVFISEPQVWYNIGQHIGVDNLNVGTEIELSYDFGTGKGFFCRPCLGAKWVF